MYKVLSEFHNNNRFTRKQMTKEEKLEYVQRCKDFSLFRVIVYNIDIYVESN
jgi:hypothetical protein